MELADGLRRPVAEALFEYAQSPAGSGIGPTEWLRLRYGDGDAGWPAAEVAVRWAETLPAAAVQAAQLSGGDPLARQNWLHQRQHHLSQSGGEFDSLDYRMAEQLRRWDGPPESDLAQVYRYFVAFCRRQLSDPQRQWSAGQVAYFKNLLVVASAAAIGLNPDSNNPAVHEVYIEPVIEMLATAGPTAAGSGERINQWKARFDRRSLTTILSQQSQWSGKLAAGLEPSPIDSATILEALARIEDTPERWMDLANHIRDTDQRMPDRRQLDRLRESLNRASELGVAQIESLKLRHQLLDAYEMRHRGLLGADASDTQLLADAVDRYQEIIEIVKSHNTTEQQVIAYKSLWQQTDTLVNLAFRQPDRRKEHLERARRAGTEALAVHRSDLGVYKSDALLHTGNALEDLAHYVYRQPPGNPSQIQLYRDAIDALTEAVGATKFSSDHRSDYSLARCTCRYVEDCEAAILPDQKQALLNAAAAAIGPAEGIQNWPADQRVEGYLWLSYVKRFSGDLAAAIDLARQSVDAVEPQNKTELHNSLYWLATVQAMVDPPDRQCLETLDRIVSPEPNMLLRKVELQLSRVDLFPSVIEKLDVAGDPSFRGDLSAALAGGSPGALKTAGLLANAWLRQMSGADQKSKVQSQLNALRQVFPATTLSKRYQEHVDAYSAAAASTDHRQTIQKIVEALSQPTDERLETATRNVLIIQLQQWVQLDPTGFGRFLNSDADRDTRLRCAGEVEAVVATRENRQEKNQLMVIVKALRR